MADRVAHTYLIQTQLTVTYDTSGPNDQILRPRRKFVDVGRSDEHSEWII